jgi:hypothetical protein
MLATQMAHVMIQLEAIHVLASQASLGMENLAKISMSASRSMIAAQTPTAPIWNTTDSKALPAPVRLATQAMEQCVQLNAH